MNLYDLAIDSAREGGFLHNEAFACELAARYFYGLNRERIGNAYIYESYCAYSRWGATAKVVDLEARYPQLLNQKIIPANFPQQPTSKQLDLESVMKASHILSGEIILSNLLAKMMHILIENAGATRGIILLEKEGQWLIEAEGILETNKVAISLGLSIENSALVPSMLINYISRTRETVVLSDATLEGGFTQDTYVLNQKPKSILCLPLLNQGILNGILYLENRLTTGAFTTDRLQVINLLAFQAGISLENARLFKEKQNYSDQLAEEVAERKQTEIALKEASIINRKIISNSPIGISIYDESGHCIETNNSMGKIIGATKKQILQENFFNIKSWRTSGIFDAARQAIKEGNTKRHISKLKSTFGESLSIECFLVPFLKENRSNLMLMVNDISERIHEEERYKKTIESSIDGFWIVDMEGKFLEVNEAYANMTGYNRYELLTMSIMDVEAVEQAEETKKRIQHIVKKGSGRFESKHRHKKGHHIDVEVSASFTKESGGLFFVFLRNITERNRMGERLRQAQKMESIGNLAGGIAHDFNNILFPILGMSEMLLEDLPDDSLEHENTQEIFHAAKRAGDLVKQILTFSRQAAHKITPVRVQNVLKEVLKLSRSTIPTNIDIHRKIQQNCGLVMADPTQIHQIAMNLITNAFHAIENENGVIDIELKQITLTHNSLPDSDLHPGQYVRLTISDNGIGMSQNIIHHIFEPYFTTKAAGKGTGLGLAVVYGIVKEHKGDIKVYSEEGKGTTFNIYLPLMKKVSAIVTANSQIALPTGTENILVVDDETSVAKLVSKILLRLGYQVTVKTNSIDALNVFKSTPDSFDLVISDMTMPHMTGDQLAKEILLINPDTPIIICTGFSERINKEQAEIAGMSGFLLKPIIRSDLAQMVRNVLDKSKNDA